jgi:hypothetical protein
MKFCGLFTLAILAGALTLATSTAQAAYSYTTTPSPATMNFGTGSTASLAGDAATGNGTGQIHVAEVSLATTPRAHLPLRIRPVTWSQSP